MRRVAIRGLLARPLRTVLTALAIVLGVAMVSGTYVLTDTIERAFNGIFSSSYKNTSAVIAGRQVVEEASSGRRYFVVSSANRPANPPSPPTTSGRLVRSTAVRMSVTARSPASMSTPEAA